MATATDAPSLSLTAADAPFDLTVELFGRMVEANLIPRERRVSLHDGRLDEKMARSKAHGSVGAAITMTVALRLPAGWSLWPESTIALAHGEPRVVDGLGEYARVETYRAGDAVPLVLDGREVARLPVGDWLG